MFFFSTDTKKMREVSIILVYCFQMPSDRTPFWVFVVWGWLHFSCYSTFIEAFFFQEQRPYLLPTQLGCQWIPHTLEKWCLYPESLASTPPEIIYRFSEAQPIGEIEASKISRSKLLIPLSIPWLVHLLNEWDVI